MSLSGHGRKRLNSAPPANVLVLKSWVHPGFALCLAIFFTGWIQAQTADNADAGLSQKQISPDSRQAQDEVGASGKSSEGSPQTSAKTTPAENSRQPADSPGARPPGGIPFYRYWNVAEPLPLEVPFLTKAATKWLSRLELNQAGAIWLSLLVTVLVAFNFRKLVCRRNADLLLLLAPSLLMVDMIRYAGGSLEDPEKATISGLAFSGLLLFGAVLLIRSLFGVFARAPKPWTPNVSRRVLAGLLLVLLACNTLVVFERDPDDCGYYANVGAAQMISAGKFPYGDPLLHGGAAQPPTGPFSI